MVTTLEAARSTWVVKVMVAFLFVADATRSELAISKVAIEIFPIAPEATPAFGARSLFVETDIPLVVDLDVPRVKPERVTTFSPAEIEDPTLRMTESAPVASDVRVGLPLAATDVGVTEGAKNPLG